MRASDDVAALTALERSFGDLSDAGRTAALVVRRGARVLLDVACGVDDDGRPFTSTTSVFLYSAVEPVAALTVLLAAADGAWREQWTWTPGDMGALLRHPPELLDAQVGNSRAGRGLVAPAVTGYGSAHDLAHLWSWWTGADGAARLGVDLQSASLSAVLTGRDHVLDREVAWGLGPQVDEDDIGMGGVGGTFGGHLPGPGLSVGFTTADLSPPGHADVLDAALALLARHQG